MIKDLMDKLRDIAGKAYCGINCSFETNLFSTGSDTQVKWEIYIAGDKYHSSPPIHKDFYTFEAMQQYIFALHTAHTKKVSSLEEIVEQAEELCKNASLQLPVRETNSN